MNPPRDDPRPRNDPLQNAINCEVAHMDEDPAEGEKYVSLVRLGHEYRATVTAENFRQRLLEAGLPRPRASEIKTILKAGDLAQRFIDREPGLGVRKALAEARDYNNDRRRPRGRRPWPGYGEEYRRARRAILRALNRLLREKAQDSAASPAWSVDCGLFVIRFNPAPVTPS